MAAKVFIFLGDSISNGSEYVSLVTAADFTRWTGTTWPSGATAPQDVSIPDVYMLTPRMPSGVTTDMSVDGITAPTTTTVDVATPPAITVDSWVYWRENTTVQGQLRKVSAFASPQLTVSAVFTAVPGNGGVLEWWSDSHTLASATATTLTKAAPGTPNFTVNALVGKWVAIISGAGVRQYRRITANTATVITVDVAFVVTPATGDGIRVLSAANTVDDIADIISTKCVVNPLRFYLDECNTYSDPTRYPNFYGLPLTSPNAHKSIDVLNAVPETMWRLRSHYEGPIYGIHVAAGGLTLAPYNVSALAASVPYVAGAYSWGIDVDHNDFRPGSTNGLYAVLQAYVTAMKTILGSIDVQGIFVNLGTNDALNNEQANQFRSNMEFLRRSLREWVATTTTSTAGTKGSSIPWIMAKVGPTTTRLYTAPINAAIESLALDDTFSEFVETSDIAYLPDTIHPTQEGHITIGERNYAAWLVAKQAAADATTAESERDTLATIRLNVRRRYERVTTSTDTLATQIDYYINESLREIYNRLGDRAWFLVVRDTITLSANSPNTAELPLKMSRPVRFEDTRYPGRRVNWRAVGRSNEGRYIITFDQLMLSEVVVFYRTAPRDLEKDEDVCIVPHEHIELIVALACKGLAEASGNATAMGLYSMKAQELWDYLFRDAARFQQQFENAIDADGTNGHWPLPSTWNL